MTLYEIPEAIRETEERAFAANGQISDEDRAALDALHVAIEAKMDAICGLVREREADAKAWKDQATFFADKARAAENAADRLKQYLACCLEAAGRSKAVGSKFTARIQTNSQPTVRWVGQGDIPEGYRRIKVELDAGAVRAAHDAGCLPEGFEVVTGSHLRIV